MIYYSTERISQRKELTPEGYLIIRDVPVSRTGSQDYTEYELPQVKARDGIVRAIRRPEHVFDGDSIASFIGKSITHEHPQEDVNPSNWQRYEVGTVLSARADAKSGVVLADFLVKDRYIIDNLKSGNTEVSVGYSADYVPISDGLAEQQNIRVNHVALVEAGRCGPLCATRDHDTINTNKETNMKDDKSLLQKLRAFLKDAEAEKTDLVKEKEETADECSPKDNEMEETFDAKMSYDAMYREMQDMKAQMDAMMRALPKTADGALVEWAAQEESEPYHEDAKETPQEEASHGTEHELAESPQKEFSEHSDSKDSLTKQQQDSLELFRQRVAIVAPHYKHTTMDSSATFNDCMCKNKLAAIDTARSGKHSDIIRKIVGDRDLTTLDSVALDVVFGAIAEAVGVANNRQLDGLVTATKTVDSGNSFNSSSTFNDAAAKYWADRK